MGGEKAKRVLSDLRKQGLVIALDDFGSGYSSLVMLLELPVDIVKLDKEFQTNIHQRDEARTMLNGIIDMLHSLGKRVVVEGIQDKEQYEFALSSKRDFLQGYYISHPVEIDFHSLPEINLESRRSM